MARSVDDLALLAGVLCESEDHLPPERPRFAVLGGIFEDRAEPAMRAAMDRLRETLVANRMELPPIAAEMPRQLRTILATEMAAYHGDRLRRHPDDYPPKIAELVDEGLRTPPADYRAALVHREAAIAAVDAMMVDGVCLVTPATPGPAPDRSTTGDSVFNALWSFTGHPTVSLPIGRDAEGLPLAAQVVGKRSEMPNLLAASAWMERQVKFDMKWPPLPTE
jgi:aspartyl-tRNA(Asn)/glutamyl-tRNA(Gln) amidotransferase subunit A